jgi:hypothetical protein
VVSPVSSISASSASQPIKVETSTSITSEPANAWVAMRQSQITADQVTQKKDGENKASNEGEPQSAAGAELEPGEEEKCDVAADADETVSATLSGESTGSAREILMKNRRLANAWQSFKCAQARETAACHRPSLKVMWV